MKQLIFFVTLTFSIVASGDTSLEVPRSQVVELKEDSTNRVYPLFIKVPRSYESSPDKSYPVIYLTDAWYSFQIVSGATRFPMNTGMMEEAIIVGVSYSKGSKGASSRIRDYTPSNADDWELQTGNADGHAKFIRETVFPYVETHYRVNPDKRTFVGNSLGGLFGSYILFKYPDMFRNYIIGSPSVWFNNHDILSEVATKTVAPINVYLSVGNLEKPEFGERQDMVKGAKQLAKKIDKEATKNLKLKFSIIKGARHSTAFPTTVIQGLDWLYGKH